MHWNQGEVFHPLTCTVLSMDASLSGWGEVLRREMVQEFGHRGSPNFFINILELRAIRLFLSLVD